jgi:hypothetical protein
MNQMLYPFITVSDPATSAEGGLDPLGLSTIADRLANSILPGLRARMSRPRFLTAMAVSAAVFEGLEEIIAEDGVTPPEIAFEWLLVEGFARSATQEETRRTPGIEKGRTCRQSGEPMRAKAYLKSPSVFGFHGVYKPLAVDMGIVDDEFRLAERGYALLKTWEEEQNLSGFIDRANPRNGSKEFRATLRSALEDALKAGYTTRSAAWQGWAFFAQHLIPTRVGAKESDLIWSFLLDGSESTRGELFQHLIDRSENDQLTEFEIVSKHLLPQASPMLKTRLLQIEAYESFCSLIEDAFYWLRYLSSQAGARAIGHDDFAARDEVVEIVSNLNQRMDLIGHRLLDAAPSVQEEYARLAAFFAGCDNPSDLYEAILSRHAEVQKNKPPEGKREWFERNINNQVFVRIPYRLDQPPLPRNWWTRPYRIATVLSFIKDLRGKTNG